MQRLTDLFHRFVAAIQPVAEHLGGPGLALVAFLDSSFLSLPEVADALLVVLTVHHPGEWLYFAAISTVGSVAGCYVIYALARKGGEAFVRRRFSAKLVERSVVLVREHGLLAMIASALLPPPAPFKLFVLLAGVADMPPRTFLTAIAIGRGARFGAEAWLAHKYGDRAMDYIRDNLSTISIWAAGIVAVLLVAMIIWRRRAVGRAADA
ncbi:MAG: VTT domain-containing protein [Acidobacteriota bacterium]